MARRRCTCGRVRPCSWCQRRRTETIACACGCGSKFPRLDKDGRPRRYKSGHNPRWAPVAERILAYLTKHGPSHRYDLSCAAGTSAASAGATLARLRDQGVVEPADGRGMWRLT